MVRRLEVLEELKAKSKQTWKNPSKDLEGEESKQMPFKRLKVL